MAVAPHNAVDHVVDRLEAISVCNTAGLLPCFVSELGEVAVEGEQVIQPILERDAVVVQNRTNKCVLAGGIHIPACWITFGGIPQGELNGWSAFLDSYRWAA